MQALKMLLRTWRGGQLGLIVALGAAVSWVLLFGHWCWQSQW